MLLTTLCLLSIIASTLSTSVPSCRGAPEYSSCSSNKECACLQRANSTDDSGICALTTLRCSAMTPCSLNGRTCHDRHHICVRHPRCDSRPLCYPVNKATDDICPPSPTPSSSSPSTTSRPSSSTSMKPFHPSCDWTGDGITVLSQLKGPTGLFLDENAEETSIYVADSGNHRIVFWTVEQASNSPVVMLTNQTGHFSYPRDIVINAKDGSAFICDKGNRRIVQWMKDSQMGQTLLSNIECESLTIDDQGSLIVSEVNKDRVTKWTRVNQVETDMKAIAGAYGQGSNLNQLNQPRNILVDPRDQSIYVADSGNHRVMKYSKGAQQGTVVAGGHGRGNATHQLAFPRGLALHSNGDLYIADTNNYRIVRWTQGATAGTIVVDGNRSNSRQWPVEPFDLVFDQHHRNLYVTDWANSRLLRFFIDGVGNCVTIT